MLRIGEFAKLCRVSVRTLRFYEECGLIRPSRVDPESGYRYYAPDLLPRVSRIVALRDLGLSLDQISAVVVSGRLSLSRLQSMLDAKRTELAAHVLAEQARLRRVEARLRQLEEGFMSEYEVIVKAIEPQLVASRRQVVPTLDDLTTALPATFDHLYAYLGGCGAHPAGAPGEVWYATERFTGTDMDIESWVPIDRAIPESAGVTVRTLPAIETMATALYRGPYDGIGPAHEALHNWIHGNQYRLAGPDRLIFHEHHRAGNPADNLIEIQYPVAPVV